VHSFWPIKFFQLKSTKPDPNVTISSETHILGQLDLFQLSHLQSKQTPTISMATRAFQEKRNFPGRYVQSLSQLRV